MNQSQKNGTYSYKIPFSYSSQCIYFSNIKYKETNHIVQITFTSSKIEIEDKVLICSQLLNQLSFIPRVNLS